MYVHTVTYARVNISSYQRMPEVYFNLDPWISESGPQTGSISITWTLIRNAEPRCHPRTLE